MKLEQLQEAKYAGNLSPAKVKIAYATVYNNLEDNQDGDVIIDDSMRPELGMKLCEIDLFVRNAKDKNAVRDKVKQWANFHKLPFTNISDPEWLDVDDPVVGNIGEYGNQWQTSIGYST